MAQAKWMEQYFEQLQHVPLHQLLLPGTHDSGAYKLTPKQFTESPKDFGLALALRLAGFFIKPWTVCQKLSVAGQLQLGVRLLDFRVSCCTVNSSGCLWPCASGPSSSTANTTKDSFATGCSFWVSHTFACEPLDVVLSDLRAFLDEAQREVVVVRIGLDWEHRDVWTPELCKALCDYVQTCLGPHLFCHSDRKPGQWATLGEMVTAGRRVALFLELSHPPPEPGPTDVPRTCWVNAGCSSYWAESDTPEGTLERLRQLIERDQTGGRGSGAAYDWTYRFAAFAATPTLNSILNGTARGEGGLQGLAQRCEKLLPQLLHSDLRGVSGVSLDYPTESAIKSIIAVNLTRATAHSA